MLTKELQDIHDAFVRVRENMKRAIFGEHQEFGIRVQVNSFFVPTQYEPWGKYVCVFIAGGTPGSGKTTGAFAASSMMQAKVNFVPGVGDITPSRLIGYYESVTKSDDTVRKVFHPGFIVPQRQFNIIDEISRQNTELQAPLANILEGGIIRLEDEDKLCAPEGDPCINHCTTNMAGSGGVKVMSEFLRDRMVAGAMLITPWKDTEHVEKLMDLKEHWEKVKREGILMPFLEPRDIIRGHEAIMKHVGPSPEIKAYQVRMLSGVVADLARPDWARKYAVPDYWKAVYQGTSGNIFSRKDKRRAKESRELPREPFFHVIGGRVPQQYDGLVRADSFMTFGSLESTAVSAQQMLKAVLWHRLMFGLNTGGQKVLQHVYQNDLVPFLSDTLNWILSVVPLPKDPKRMSVQV